MNAVKRYERSFKVGRYRCDLIVTLLDNKPLGCAMTWQPEHPRNFSKGWLAEYQRKRNAAMEAIGNEADICISVVDA